MLCWRRNVHVVALRTRTVTTTGSPAAGSGKPVGVETDSDRIAARSAVAASAFPTPPAPVGSRASTLITESVTTAYRSTAARGAGGTRRRRSREPRLLLYTDLEGSGSGCATSDAAFVPVIERERDPTRSGSLTGHDALRAPQERVALSFPEPSEQGNVRNSVRKVLTYQRGFLRHRVASGSREPAGLSVRLKWLPSGLSSLLAAGVSLVASSTVSCACTRSRFVVPVCGALPFPPSSTPDS